MGESVIRKWALPDQATQPPDVVRWLTELANAADGTFLYGPKASVPATLPAGVFFFAWDA